MAKPTSIATNRRGIPTIKRISVSRNCSTDDEDDVAEDSISKCTRYENNMDSCDTSLAIRLRNTGV